MKLVLKFILLVLPLLPIVMFAQSGQLRIGSSQDISISDTLKIILLEEIRINTFQQKKAIFEIGVPFEVNSIITIQPEYRYSVFNRNKANESRIALQLESQSYSWLHSKIKIRSKFQYDFKRNRSNPQSFWRNKLSIQPKIKNFKNEPTFFFEYFRDIVFEENSKFRIGLKRNWKLNKSLRIKIGYQYEHIRYSIEQSRHIITTNIKLK